MRYQIIGDEAQSVPKETGSVTQKDVYGRLAEMIDKEDVVGMPPTPSFLKVLSLQFTPDTGCVFPPASRRLLS